MNTDRRTFLTTTRSLGRAKVFDAGGGTVAGKTDGMVSAGSLTPDLDDAVAFFCHTILTNALGADTEL